MPDIKQVIVVRKDLAMRKGKMCAQVAHAAMKFILDNNDANKADKIQVDLTAAEAEWVGGTFTKIVVGCDSEDELEQLILKAQVMGVTVHKIIDNGNTEFHGEKTLTCAAFGPAYADELNPITAHLKLL
jgi:peptidyl-tRNA hydrolase, PTH2 family